jgi:hypothetical protein
VLHAPASTKAISDSCIQFAWPEPGLLSVSRAAPRRVFPKLKCQTILKIDDLALWPLAPAHARQTIEEQFEPLATRDGAGKRVLQFRDVKAYLRLNHPWIDEVLSTLADGEEAVRGRSQSKEPSCSKLSCSFQTKAALEFDSFVRFLEIGSAVRFLLHGALWPVR